MKKNLFLIFVLLIFVLFGCADKEASTNNGVEQNKLKVAVSILPEKSIVEAIGKDKVEVVNMIPAGNSPANYAPTQKEMVALSDSKIYFGIGVPTENANILPLIESGDYDLKIVHLEEEVSKKYPDRYFGEVHDHDDKNDDDAEEHSHEHEHDEEVEEHSHEHEHDEEVEEHSHEHEHAEEVEEHSHEHEHAEEVEEHSHEHEHAEDEGEHHGHSHTGRDPHIWLSPKRVKLMSKLIANELIALDPNNADFYNKNLDEFLMELDKVDKSIKLGFTEFEGKPFLIYHPSLGYFADEYNLQMIALESDGKAATVQGMTEVINFAKMNNIKTVFYQAEFDSKQAKLLAGEIKGNTVQLNPLSPYIIDNFKQIAEHIEKSFK